MRRTARPFRLIAGLAAAVLVLGACGGGDDTRGDVQRDARTLKIGVIAPLSGDLSALGAGIRNGAELAIQQANEENRIPGYELELGAEDDTAKPDVGAQVATELASDDEVVAVIGTANSDVAESVQPVLSDAGIAMVSPANTGVNLTKGADAENPRRPYSNYFRVSITDDVQGLFAANFVSSDVKATEVAIVHDNKTYGKGLAAAFAERFESNGGEIVLTDTVDEGDKDFSAVVSRIRRARPDLVYYGGEYPAASLLSRQMDEAGVDAPLMGGDGVYDDTYIEVGGEAVVGDFATSAGPPLAGFESAADFLSDYEAAGFDDPPSAHSGYAYDAASVIIAGLEDVLDQGEGEVPLATVRTELIQALQGVEIDGVTGPVAFDKFGDTTTKVLTVYTVKPAEQCAQEDEATATTGDDGVTTSGDDDERTTTTTEGGAGGGSPSPCWEPEKTDEFD